MNEEFKKLLEKYLDRTMVRAEKEALAQLLELPGNQILLAAFIDENFENNEIENLVPEVDSELIYQRILTSINQNETSARIVPLQKRSNKLKWIAAAVILIAIGVGTYFSFFNKQPALELAKLPQQERFKNDISPAKQGVLLTLADGSTQMLDTVPDGSVVLQGSTRALKEDESISYTPNNSGRIVYNTIATQKGKVFHLKLADGTEVWLDALSSIHFPTAFPGADRIVEVAGQAYFEVAKNPEQPFRVKTGSQVIEVLGTHFNINTYDSQNIKTTLLEGSVKVSSPSHGQFLVLKPGQQSTNANGSLKTQRDVDLDQVMAWKNGRFQFNGSGVKEIMSQISRWYDIKVEYRDTIKETFVAEIQRDLPLSKLLGLLEMTKQVKFTIEGNKVTVMKW